MAIKIEIIEEIIEKINNEPLSLFLKALSRAEEEDPGIRILANYAVDSWRKNPPKSIEDQTSLLMLYILAVGEAYRQQQKEENRCPN